MNNIIKNINIWECSYKNNCTFLYTFEELIKFIEDNNLDFSFLLHEKQYPGNTYECIIDKYTDINNVSITYTSKEHPITILNQYDNKILINPTFFEQNKNKFKEYYKKILFEIIKTNPISLIIPNYLIDDEFIDYITTSENLKETNIIFTEVNDEKLTEEHIKKIKEAHLQLRCNKEEISTKYVISSYSINSLKNTYILNLKEELTDEEVNNFIYLNKQAYVVISPTKKGFVDEVKYTQNLSRIFKILSTHNRNYTIKITIDNRELLNKAHLLDYPNINLTIENDLYNYQTEEYIKEEKQLDDLIIHIKEANLSPYEKFLAVYNIVKQFKTYKENKENINESRHLRYILNNDFIVCRGFSKLLETLLNKIGIPNEMISVKVDVSFDNGFTEEEIPVELAGHSRNIIKLDDDKYNIHGIFLADATWDNDIYNDLYQNASITFDRKKEADRLELLSNIDLLLDFHTIEEFKEKINFFIKREINNQGKNEDFKEKKLFAYNIIYTEIRKLLLKLDYEKCTTLFSKYDDKLNKAENTFEALQKIYSDFLAEYAEYIIPLSNKKIDNNTLLDAAVFVRKFTDRYKDEETAALREKLKKINESEDLKSFPYLYIPNETAEHYFEDASTTKKR